MNHRVLIATRSFGSTSQEPWELLREAGCEIVRADLGIPMTQERLIALLDGASGAIIGVVPLTAQVFAQAPSLRVVSMHGVGVNHIDLAAAQRHGVVIANCPGANSHGVADLAFGLMIDLARSISIFNAEVHTNIWRSRQGTELWQKTLGLIGLGAIGQGVARRARGFDMRVLAYDPYASQEAVQMADAALVTLDELLAASDFVSLHAPLTPETQNLLSVEQLALMPAHAFLVNTARGELVDNAALYDALKNERLAGAAFDAFSVEPPWGNPLLELPNFLATPHIGAHTVESIERVGVMAVRNLLCVFEGKEPLHRVA